MNQVVTSRKCWKCGVTKPLTDFWRDKCDKELGLQKRCKPCSSARNKEYSASHREYFKQKGKEKYDPSQNAARYQKTKANFLQRRHAELTSVKGRLQGLLLIARNRALKNSIPFSLTLPWVLQLYKNQQGCCLLTGIPLTFEMNPDGKRFYMPYSPSLDQIRPGEGYTESNTRLVCVAVNLALNRFGEEVLQRVSEGFLRYRASLADPAMPPVTEQLLSTRIISPEPSE